MLPKYKNSWFFSILNPTIRKYEHHYFCSCSKKFKVRTEIDEPEAPDVLCPICGNDYFKDSIAFENMSSTKIWKEFKWLSRASEDKECWRITLKYETPIYCYDTQSVELIEKDLLSLTLLKDGSEPYAISYSSKIISQYNFFLDDKVQQFKRLLLDEAKENLYNYVMMNKSRSIAWIDDNEIKDFSADNRLEYITFFLKNPHLKEHRFFFWRMDQIHNHTMHHSTQIEMLDFIADNHREKSVKKALYQYYEDSMKHIGYYYPYSDYIFSRSIENIDLLIKLYRLYPAIKEHIFTDENFSVAIEFILFLKQHYTEKQIVKLFVEDIQNKKEYKNRLNNWRDTLRILRTRNSFKYLEEHFSKVKLTTKKLHDEIIRVFHIVSYELDAKENFEYDKKYLSACKKYEDLEFRLPATVKELSLWAKILHNCMFGYSRRIYEQQSVIYGIFRAEELLYAVELNEFRIVQAKAIFNKDIPSDDMSTINSWQKSFSVF
jgi:hypothetical protein